MDRLRGRVRPPTNVAANSEAAIKAALLTKTQNHYRKELDYADRQHSDRIDAEDHPPEPMVLTLEETRSLLGSTQRFKDRWLPSQRKLGLESKAVADLDHLEAQVDERIETLTADIQRMEATERGSEA